MVGCTWDDHLTHAKAAQIDAGGLTVDHVPGGRCGGIQSRGEKRGRSFLNVVTLRMGHVALCPVRLDQSNECG